MSIINEYAQIRNEIANLEKQAKALEPHVIEELLEEKAKDTDYGKVITVSTVMYTYSEELQEKEKLAKNQINELTKTLMEPIKEAKKAEEETLEPIIKFSLRFTPAKGE